MDYQFENLGPERFQEFCQALLTLEFPEMQCFPVMQPDGGRDAAIHFDRRPANEYSVFQVKFVKSPDQVINLHEWILKIIEGELPKIKKLISRGVKSYILITNVEGTAHLDVGSIDKLNKLIGQTIGIPHQTIWRSDLSRRIEGQFDLKWSYPELLSGLDVLQILLKQGVAENYERISNAIISALRDQFESDKQVKFKQVEIQNDLLELFVDVPVNRRALRQLNRRTNTRAQYLLHRVSNRRGISDIEQDEDERNAVGTASILLDSHFSKEVPLVVLEGAPGQGKSTVAQYVCQVYRKKILELNPGLDNTISIKQKKVPLKIDLRDLSLWLSKKDPFQPEEPSKTPERWEKSLESFLCALIKHHSGGVSFDVSDLQSCVRCMSLILVFDGLDEVADLQKRKIVVDELVKGVNRLQSIAASIQVVVTSRPAIFADAPAFPEEKYAYLALGPINKALIDEYAEKWIKAKGLDPRDSSNVRRILKEKVDLPHLRELARNPMQLTILLSLIHTRGTSLPDKRTALYDSYVELFFSRESEKSIIVREHRDLLIDIHGYLAWYLHSQAELDGNSGSIRSDELRILVKSYLKSEQHEVALGESLFTGMVERVVFLVSRVEGTFEFEIQPLREYFAAKYLYTTAQYSPVGNEKKGTLPDRFDAICRNQYWFNVTRFYAGYYNKGELPSLVDRLEELGKDKIHFYTKRSYHLIATLLSDWVFAQHPKSMIRAVNMILTDLGLRALTPTGSEVRRHSTTYTLPSQCGREQLVERCLELLEAFPPYDRGYAYLDLLRANSTREEVWPRLLAMSKLKVMKSPDVFGKWIFYAQHFGLLSEISTQDANDLILENGSLPESRKESIFWTPLGKYFEKSEPIFESALDNVLDGKFSKKANYRATRVLEMVSLATRPWTYLRTCIEGTHEKVIDIVSKRYFDGEGFLDVQSLGVLPEYGAVSKCIDLINMAKELCACSAREWATELKPWDTLVNKGEEIFGNRWVFYALATSAAGISENSIDREMDLDLFDKNISLCSRARLARLKAGNVSWWTKQFQVANERLNKMFCILAAATWTGPATLIKLLPILNAQLKTLSSSDWSILYNTYKGCVRIKLGGVRNSVVIQSNATLKGIDARTGLLLVERLDESASGIIYDHILSEYDGDDINISEQCLDLGISQLIQDQKMIDSKLKSIARFYKSFSNFPRGNSLRYLQHRIPEANAFSLNAAKKILDSADLYPLSLTGFAEHRCGIEAAKHTIPVGKVSNQENWFE